MRPAFIAATIVLLVSPVRPASAQSLSGLYLQNQSMGRGDVWHYYYFWPDGHMCNAMPKGGLNPAPSYPAVAAANPGQCGTFAIRGKSLDVQTDGGGKPVSLKLDNVDKSGFSLSGFPTIHAPAFPPGAVLNGTWKTLMIFGSDYRNWSYTFHPDGRYEFDDARVRAVGAPPRHLTGTYTLVGNTVRITSPNGAETKSIHPFPADSRLSIEGVVMEKKP